MKTNVLQYLEKTVCRVPDKVAFANENCERTFKEVYDNSRAIGSQLSRDGFYNQPIVVYMKKHPDTIISFFGTIYGGNYYVPLDDEMPMHKLYSPRQ